MGKERIDISITDEVIAAYMDGCATEEETRAILHALAIDPKLRELMEVSMDVDGELDMLPHEEHRIIPMTALAATCDEGQYCCLVCEEFILDKRGIAYCEDELLDRARAKGWLSQEGTPLHQMGRHLESMGLVVSRRYGCGMDDIAHALDQGLDVMVVVDGGGLLGDPDAKREENLLVGAKPNHAVVVTGYDAHQGTVSLHDPNSARETDTYPVAQFIGAWQDSDCYLLAVSAPGEVPYVAYPIDLSSETLDPSLVSLQEAIAENAHEVWAKKRQAEGWTYGPERNDVLKQTPDMVPYACLPEGEKLYDREMANNTILLLSKLGYDIVRRVNSELYLTLKERLKYATGDDCHCPGCGNVIYPRQPFCDRCGKDLRTIW